MSHVPRSLRDFVRSRANDTCEYCRMPQAFYRAPFQPDHHQTPQAAAPQTAGLDQKAETGTAHFFAPEWRKVRCPRFRFFEASSESFLVHRLAGNRGLSFTALRESGTCS